mgnify:FL=1
MSHLCFIDYYNRGPTMPIEIVNDVVEITFNTDDNEVTTDLLELSSIMHIRFSKTPARAVLTIEMPGFGSGSTSITLDVYRDRDDTDDTFNTEVWGLEQMYRDLKAAWRRSAGSLNRSFN